jgi:hypothetical protein
VTRPLFPCFLEIDYILLGLPLYVVPSVLRFLCHAVTMRKLSAWESELRTELKRTDFWLQETLRSSDL